MDRSAPLRPDLLAIFRCLPRQAAGNARRKHQAQAKMVGILAALAAEWDHR